MIKETSLKKIERNPDNKLTTFQSYLSYFFLFSIAGWVMEIIFCFIVLGHYNNRGFLYGPLCPIYGYGGLILLVFIQKLKKNPFKVAFSSMAMFTSLEYIFSYGTEALFKSELWNYTNDYMNVNGRIAIFYTLAWGIIALVFVYLLLPLLKKLITKISSKIPHTVQVILLGACTIILIIDIIFTFIKYANLHI